MATPKVYTVEDSETGKVVTFEWYQANDPSESDIAEVIQSMPAGPAERVGEISETPPRWKQLLSAFTRPALEYGGMAGGATVGAGSSGPVGAVAGGALGYAGGANVADVVDESLGLRLPQDIPGRMVQAGKDLWTGAKMEATGQTLGAAVPAIGRGLGKIGVEIHGRMTGVGAEASREAFRAGAKSGLGKKGTDAFAKALRGKITGQEVVDNTKSALNIIKENRGSNYRQDLHLMAKQGHTAEFRPVRDELDRLMSPSNFNIGRTIKNVGGKQKISYDLKKSAMFKKGAKDVKAVAKIVDEWETMAGDKVTALELDTLKRQLDDFYSESGKARAFVSSLRKKVKDTLVAAVPEYAVMTRDYENATRIIKDIETGLMLRKSGMSGRVVADQTLRRLMSVTRSNFPLRAELVRTLGSGAGEDIMGQVAGYAMSPYIPRGLAGTKSAMLGEAALAYYVSPAFWPVLAASSPRVSGEFIRFMGKTAATVKGTGPGYGRAVAYLSTLRNDAMREEKQEASAESGAR